MGNKCTKPSQQVGNFDIIIHQKSGSSPKNLILILFPGKKIRNKGNQQKSGDKQKQGPGDFPGSFITGKLFPVNIFLFLLFKCFRISFLRIGFRLFTGSLFQLIGHGGKDNIVCNLRMFVAFTSGK